MTTEILSDTVNTSEESHAVEVEIEAEAEGEVEVEVEVAELIEILKQRGDTYTLLARLYREEISEELLSEMHGRLYPAETGDDKLHTGYLYIATYLSNLWSGSLDELRADFSRCFLGHGVDAYSAAYPYESVYTSAKRLTMQAARDDVLAIYRANNIQKTNEWKEGEDHISLEMDFLRILGERTVSALEEGKMDTAKVLLKTQLEFLEAHLFAWSPMLTADLKKFAATKMYLGLAYLTEGFLRADRLFLKDF